MDTSIHVVSASGLLWAFCPALVVIALLYRWTTEGGTALYATIRMLVQLLLIGYILMYIFKTESPGVIGLVLGVMVIAASWIALRPLKRKQPHLYGKAFGAIVMGGMLCLILTTQVILQVDPWYYPRYTVPLAGMIFASSMNTVSLAAERFEAELERTYSYIEARNTALYKSLIPITNSLLAVGLVSLPGMMSGQILSGISPLVAAKYQIVIMAIIFGASGISATLYLVFVKKESSRIG